MSATRAETLKSLRRNGHFDVIVVGGGINGIGTYRDLALQGLRVLLVEKRDFASGYSAAPSRMIHGGLRYLENGEFDLVRESLQERDALLRNAPHMVQPLPTAIPLTSVFSGLFNAAAAFLGRKGKPASRGVLPVKMGLVLYDWVTRKRRQLPRHRVRGRNATRALWPDLAATVRYTAVYHDAWISNPERLCMELLQDAPSGSPGNAALNYCELQTSDTSGGFTLLDHRSGAQFPVTTRAIVNASGAWLDGVARDLGRSAQTPMVAGTKGSHLILDNTALYQALGGHMIFFENTDGRVCIMFPYLGKVLAGSTDIRVSEPGRVRCEPDERDYILKSIQLVFPKLAIHTADVVFSYSGIRPLPQSDHDFTGRISRGHDIRRLDGAIPQFCMIGGKWTTFRVFAEQTADAVLAELGQTRKVRTLDRAIGGGAQFPGSLDLLEQQLVQDFAISAARAKHMASHYGTGAAQVLCACLGQADDLPLASGCAYTAAEMAFLARSEMTVTMSDLVLRRTSLAITGALDGALLNRIKQVFATATGLDDCQAVQQCAELTHDLINYHGLSPQRLAQEPTRSTQCE